MIIRILEPNLGWGSWLWQSVHGEQISGQDKPSTPMATTPTPNSSHKSRSHPVPINNMEMSQHSGRLSEPSFSAYQVNHPQGDVFSSFH